MKQHITKKQWNELGKKEKNLFYKNLSQERKINLSIFWNQPIFEVQVNIGQMIEFLGDDLKRKDEYNITWWEPEELCDVLWKAVKYKLND